jgi:hypothetical protein
MLAEENLFEFLLSGIGSESEFIRETFWSEFTFGGKFSF